MLNPITYTEDVVRDFLRYQLTTYGFADTRLHGQLRSLLSLEETRNTPLMKGPFVSLSRAFRQGASIDALVDEGVLHPHFRTLAPHPFVRGHQEAAFRSIREGKTTLVATGTGSGKTECFLYPIISHALGLRDQNVPPGVTAVIVYPMNALAADQLKRLRELLAGSGVTFGMYVGWTPELRTEVKGHRLADGASHADWVAEQKKAQERKDPLPVMPPEERGSREEMRASPPRILLTNVKQLELLLTRQTDIELFDRSQLKYLVFDEAHTFSGAIGAESAVLIRRLRTFCGKSEDDVIGVATSATIADPVSGVEAGREFASRFFGIEPGRVALIGEAYEADDWAPVRTLTGPLPGDPSAQLANVLEVVRGVEGPSPDPAAVKALTAVVRSVTGSKLDGGKWPRGLEELYDVLAQSELVYQIAEALARPQPLDGLVETLKARVGRDVPQEEVLVWLALGSIARRGGRPLLRPVVHVFVRGMAGAVVTFPMESAGPRLWLSAADADAAGAVGKRLPILTCTTCAQHYLAHRVEDLDFTEKAPGGGKAVEGGRYWEALDDPKRGTRVLLLDRVAGEEEDAGGDDDPPTGTATMFLCRTCGALHQVGLKGCLGCGRSEPLVEVLAVRQDARNPGELRKCVACKAMGRMVRGRFREPARPVRAVAVSDIHVLAQNMLHRAERPRLLVFADNRQDAAFQAGWMQDHARRYHLRGLMWQHIAEGRISVGDLVARLDARLDQDDPLSQALLPEVWNAERKAPASDAHELERKVFLRMQVLREVAVGLRQRIGLEPWGRLEVTYLGLDIGLPFIEKWSEQIGCTPLELTEGVALLLDIARRSGALYDNDTMIYTRRFDHGTRPVQRGYIPEMQGLPKALKLQREDGDKDHLSQWLGRSLTRAKQVVKAWGVEGEAANELLSELWLMLSRDLKIIVPVTLAWANGGAIPGCVGAYQVDVDRLKLGRRSGRWRCDTCRRTQLRSGPKASCVQWRCSGKVRFENEDPDDYDLRVIDEGFRLIRPREHSAQVPADRRADYENWFKNENIEVVNTLVSTPTLELGVDIGALDAVLMRNVPPLPANYWQRAGRAGRRHRMSVNVTYAHARSHDRAYFEDPLKLLGGAIAPPRFNLKNPLMLRKHVHATVLTVLHQGARPGSGLDEAARAETAAILERCFPRHVKTWLFDEQNHVRTRPYDVSSLTSALARHRRTIDAHLASTFLNWPEADREVATPEVLTRFVDEMGTMLADVVRRLESRLKWAMDQLERLRQLAKLKGTLDPEEEALRTRAEALINKLKGRITRRSQDAEGYDDTYTMAVLAAEGFLPGYGLDGGGVMGFFEAPRFSHLRDFELRRPPALALREYVPGNMIYANGHTFTARTFRFPPDKPTAFSVDREAEAVREKGLGGQVVAGLNQSAVVDAMQVSDCDLPNMAQISDEEETRFQLPVSVFGYAKDRHAGGHRYQWGAREVQIRRQQHLRLVNVGATSEVRAGRLGYPVCLVCGLARSPFASDAELKHFEERHTERCGRKPGRLGFYSDVIADCVMIQGCQNKREAWSVGEALKQGAADVLDMQREDLVALVLGLPGESNVDLVIYDPMPGGSGLLDQILERWDEVCAAARSIVEGCPGSCGVSCIDCLRHYRNQWAHDHLDRHLAANCLTSWGSELEDGHPIPPRMEQVKSDQQPIGKPAERLQGMFARAGFPSPKPEFRIDLGYPLKHTDVDFFFEDPTQRSEGVCVYVDGLSAAIHGNAEQRTRDAQIREELQNRDYVVVVIAATEIDDQDVLAGLMGRIARHLLGKESAAQIRQNRSWYQQADDEPIV